MLERFIMKVAFCIALKRDSKTQDLLLVIKELVKKTEFWELVHLNNKYNVPVVNEILDAEIRSPLN